MDAYVDVDVDVDVDMDMDVDVDGWLFTSVVFSRMVGGV